MNAIMRSFVKGLLPGCVSRAQFPKKEPVAYLYNGVRLPKEPDVFDRYPNKYILQTTDGAYMLYESTSTQTVSVHDGKNGYMTPVYLLRPGRVYEVNENTWVEGYFGFSGYVIWSNVDVYYGTSEDLGELAGKLYLTKSSPVSTADGASYNGIELPKLPTLAYPYKVIYVSGNVYYFVHSASEIQYRADATLTGVVYDEPCQKFKLDNDQWVFVDDSSWYASTIVWAKHDIPNLVDSGIYRYADDDPIPVYE